MLRGVVSAGVVLLLVACSGGPGGRLSERIAPAPALAYGRPLVLGEGLRLTGTDLAAHLEGAGYRRTEGELSPGSWRRVGRRVEIERNGFRYPDGEDPGGRVVVELRDDGRTGRVEDGTGRAVEAAFLEPPVLGTLDAERSGSRERVPLAAFPSHVIDAVLVTEDRRFRWHPGIDPIRVVGAWRENRRAGRIVEGASTITQQLVKNVYLTPERTWSRKLREAVLSVWLEVRYSKDEILEAYLNEVYLGQDGGRPIHGFGPASHFYFGKDVSSLGVPEAALLAGIIRAPNSHSPFRHPKRARARRDQVLGFLHSAGHLEGAAHAAAVASGLGVRRAHRAPLRAGHFLEFVRGRHAGSEPRARGDGARVFTTLDFGFQRAAERAVEEGLGALEAGHPLLRRPRSPLQAALVALDPRSGDVLAHVGGRDFARSPFDRALRARRQPGSVFKPFVALAALATPDGRRFTLDTILADEPLQLEVEGRKWEPENHDRRHRGPVTMRRALADSLNVPFVRLGLEVGLVHVAETARALGVAGPLRPVPSLSLGSFEMTPLEVATAYGALAAEGVLHRPRAILATMEPRGRVRPGTASDPERVATPAAARLVTEALQEAVRRGTGRSLARLGVAAPVAGKTGTTNDFRDAWFVGYSPDLVVAVWVGFDDAARSASRAPAPRSPSSRASCARRWGETACAASTSHRGATPPRCGSRRTGRRGPAVHPSGPFAAFGPGSRACSSGGCRARTARSPSGFPCGGP
jgi:penicillin-binding protein 1B